MAVSPISAHAARGLDLVAMFATHAALHDARDGRPGDAAAPAPAPPPRMAGPLSAALVHPTRRPAFLALATAGRGAGARAGQSRRLAALADTAVAALPPAWQRMQPGERRPSAIPARATDDLALQAQSVHGQRTGAALNQGGGASARPAALTVLADAALGVAGQLARKAVLERARFMAPLLAAA